MRRKQPMSADAALARLEELCARSEQSSHDLRQKLVRWGVEPAAAEEVMASLIDRRFVDDARFARAYVRDKYRFDRWGRMKIVSGLIAKRINREIIDEALQEIDVREYARNCFRLLQAKLRQLPDGLERYEQRQRLLRFGAGRGYEAALIVKILDMEKLWTGGER